MANLVQTVTVAFDIAVSNRRLKVVTVSTDTGNYATGGNAVTAAQCGLKKFDWVGVAGASTSGTSGATALPVGVTLNSAKTSATIQYYEGSAAGTILGEKTNAEAMPSNQTVSLLVLGF